MFAIYFSHGVKIFFIVIKLLCNVIEIHFKNILCKVAQTQDKFDISTNFHIMPQIYNLI